MVGWNFFLESLPCLSSILFMGEFGKAVGDKESKCHKSHDSALETSGTEIIADVDIGWGNKLFIRGEGCGLSWEKGVPMQNIENHLWRWECPGKCPENFQYKLLINDHIWALGENLTANRGTKNFIEPSF
jgi:hypothetical protein